MAMQVTFGSFSPDPKPGHLRPVYFPQLARMDEATPDGRLLSSSGGGARDLPRSIMGQFTTEPGHFAAEIVGTLQEVTLHEDGNVSGKGWLLDDANGLRMEHYLQTDALRHNSVDLADVQAEIEWKSDDPSSPDFWEYTMIFTEWKIATTTFVNVPAFPDARGELTASYDRSAPLEVTFASTTIEMEVAEPSEEIKASFDSTVPWDDFHRPEPDKLQPLRIDEHGVVTFHLAEWGKCHDGIENRCVLAPRPSHYADFHGPGVLTDRGTVETGPVFLLGGHPAKPLGGGDRWAAYGGVENAWADVRVINGRLGPWCSGRVRPGVSADAIYAARASKVSGHWRTDKTLAAIVSCNVPGFRIPGSKLAADRDGGIVKDGQVLELVASLHAPEPEEAPDRTAIEEKLLKAVQTRMTWTQPTPAAGFVTSGNSNSINIHIPDGDTLTGVLQIPALSDDGIVDPPPDPDEEEDEAATDAELLALEMELEDLPLQA